MVKGYYHLRVVKTDFNVYLKINIAHGNIGTHTSKVKLIFKRKKYTLAFFVSDRRTVSVTHVALSPGAFNVAYYNIQLNRLFTVKMTSMTARPKIDI